MSSDYNNISQFFSHPLVLLLIGAAISGVLIPYFTNRAAKYQKGLEIKTDLVRRVNESVMRVVVSLKSLLEQLTATNVGEYAERPDGIGFYYRNKDLENQLEEIKKQLDQDGLEDSTKVILDQKQKQVSGQLESVVESMQKIETLYVEAENEFRQWEVSSAVIESQIKSYFPEFGERTERKLTWDVFSDTVWVAYNTIHEFYLNVLYQSPEDRYWGYEMIQKLLKEKEEIIHQIQNSSVSGLSEPLFSRFIRKITTPRPEPIKPEEKITTPRPEPIKPEEKITTPRPEPIKPEEKKYHFKFERIFK